MKKAIHKFIFSYGFTFTALLLCYSSAIFAMHDPLSILITKKGDNAILYSNDISIQYISVVEDCSNGIDDDGDGLIDCSDPDCIGSCPSATDCTLYGDVIDFSVSGTLQAGYTDEFVLTDINGIVIQITSLNQFSGVVPGDYILYHVNYRIASGITGLVVGQPISNITGACFEVSGGEIIKVCPDIRLLCVDPLLDEITIKNFGTNTRDISGMRLCSATNYTTDLSSQNITAGSLILGSGDEVTLVTTTINLDDNVGSLGLYTSSGSFSDAAAMLDFTQWGAGGQDREDIAISRGIWTAGDYIDGPEPFCYNGSGPETGVDLWCPSAIIMNGFADQVVCAMDNATFSVTTHDVGSQMISYQWQENTGSGWSDITGETTATLALSSIDASDNGNQYRVVVSTASCMETSMPATLTVEGPLTINTQPTAVTICEGDDAVFNVSADVGIGTLSYQWQENTGSGWSDLSGETTSSLNLSTVSASMDGNQYRVIVSSGICGSAISNVTPLTVHGPIAFLQQPADITTCVIGTANMGVTINAGSAPLITYQWQVNDGSGWTNLTNNFRYAGTTSSVLTISNMINSLSGNQYRVMVSAGQCLIPVSSNISTLILEGEVTIDSDPVDMTTCHGDNATFSVSATNAGDNNLLYQWQENDGSGWSDLAGETNATLTLNSVLASMHGNTYRVRVSTNTCPESISMAATLSIEGPVSIDSAPGDMTVCDGDAANFNVSASTPVGSISYQWQENTGSGWVNIAGETSTSLNLSTVTAAMTGNQYRVLVNTNICAPTPTSHATLTVEGPLTISSPPANTTVCDDNIAMFSVTADGGIGVLNYQWQESTDGGGSYNDITGETGASLVLNNVSTSMDGNQYRVLVGTAACNPIMSSSAVLTIEGPINISDHPDDKIVCDGDNTSFGVVASVGNSTPIYQWQVDNGSGWADLPGETSANLNLAAVVASMDGWQYRVMVSSSICSAIPSNIATLNVEGPITITTDPVDVTTCDGNGVSFSATADGGTGTLSYQWQVNDGSGWANLTGETNNSLNLASVTSAMNTWQYRLMVSTGNCPGVPSAAAILTVEGPVVITTQPDNEGGCVNGTATFSVTADGGAGTLNYQWQENTGSGWSDLTGETNADLTVSNLTLAMQAYQYRAIINTGQCAAITSDVAALSVDASAQIIAHPADVVTCVESDATFSSLATTASGLLTFQWEESTDNGATWTPLNDNFRYTGTNAITLTVRDVPVGFYGYLYRLAVSTASCDPVFSNSAMLAVEGPISVTNQPASQSTCDGSDVLFEIIADAGIGTLYYQWQINEGSGWMDISGATASTLNVTGVDLSMDGNQYRVLMNTFDCTTVTSDAATLSINGNLGTATISGTTTIVVGNTTDLTVDITSGTAPYTVVYNDGTTDITVSDYNSGDPITVSPLVTTTYSLVSVTDVNTCSASTLAGPAIVTVQGLEEVVPVAVNDINTTNVNMPVIGNVMTNDFDPQGFPLTVTTTLVNAPAQGNTVLNPDGSYTYTPDPGAVGEDEFCYEIANALGYKDTACVVVEIIPLPVPSNNPPVAIDDNAQTPENTPVKLAILANDFDPDGNNTLALPVVTVGSANGSIMVNPDGTVIYTPNTGFVGQDDFTYQLCDTGNPVLCDIATATIDILPPAIDNEAPIGMDDAVLTQVSTPVSADVSTNDYDPDNNVPLGFAVIENPSSGILSFNGNGSYTYTPNTNFVGNDTYTYEVCDNGTPVLCDTATVVLTIQADEPEAINDIAITTENMPVSGNVLTNDDEPQELPLMVNAIPVSEPDQGSVVLNPDGTYTYTPDPGIIGEDEFCYELTNNLGLVDEACVIINIIPVAGSKNDPPVAINDNVSTAENVPVDIVVLSNDLDPDGNETLGLPILTSMPPNGTVTLNPDGTFTYTPNLGYLGEDNFTYEVCDNGAPALCNDAEVIILIEPDMIGNNPPVGVDDAALTQAGTPVSGDISTNDYDTDNNTPLDFTAVLNPSNGILSLNGNGSYTYVPNAAYVGNDSYTYEVCDNGTPVLCDTATVILTIQADAPNAVNDIAVTNENEPVTGNVLVNDDDPQNLPLTVAVIPISGPGQGFALFSPDGNYTYNPDPGATGEDEFCYELTNSLGLKDTACVFIEVMPITSPQDNYPPIAVNDNVETLENTPVIIGVLENDVDGNGDDNLSIPIITTAPPNGTVAVNADGTITYTPAPGFTGEVTFNYETCDLAEPTFCDEALVTIYIYPDLPDNNPPIAVDDAELSQPNSVIVSDVSGNDYDLDNNTPLSFSLVASPSNGVLIFNPDGSYEYVVDLGYAGNDNFQYEVCDSGTPVLCDTGVVDITIIPEPPLATDDIVITSQSVPVNGNVLTNDADPQGLALTVSSVPVSGPGQGSVILNGDGTYTYTPNAGVVGEDEFCYEVSNSVGLEAIACVTVEIIPIASPIANNAPVAVNDNVSTIEDIPVIITVLSNDFDPDGNNSLSNPLIVSPPSNGGEMVNPDGTLTYSPDPGFTGLDTLMYEICDSGTPALCDVATVVIQVKPKKPIVISLPENTPPVGVDDAGFSFVNTPVIGQIGSNDYDADANDTLTYAVVLPPANGTLEVLSNGTYAYTPTVGYIGNDSYIYEVYDNGTPVLRDTATVVLAIQAVGPEAVDDIATTSQEVPVNGNVLTNDDDPQNLPLFVNTTAVSDPGQGSVILNSDGTYTYIPDPGASGEDEFCYELSNSLGLLDTACVVVEIIPLPGPGNDAPIAVNDNVETIEDLPVTIVVLNNDVDPDGNASLGLPSLIGTPSNGAAMENGDGTITYTPNTGFTGEDIFTYEVCDDGMPMLCDTAEVTVLITPDLPGNNPPIGIDDVGYTQAETPIIGNVDGNDYDTDNNIPLSFHKIIDPSNGTLSFDGDGSYVYTPNEGFVGNDLYTYEIRDSGTPALCDTVTVVLTVQADRPEANNDITTTNENVPVSSNVLTNDDDPQDLPLFVNTMPISNPGEGSVNISTDGTYTYTPNPGFTGEDVFCYELSNSLGLLDTACVTIEIIPVSSDGNDAPVAVNDNVETQENVPVNIVALSNDIDPDGNAELGLPSLIGLPSNGTAMETGDGTINYTPAPGFMGEDVFTYEVCDNGTPALCDTADVTVLVIPDLPGNSPPVGVDDAAYTTVNVAITENVGDNDYDLDNTPPLSYALVEGVAQGILVLSPNGDYTYVPNTNYIGNDEFIYQVCDNGSPVKCDTATVSLTVEENSITMKLKVLLQGAMWPPGESTTLMNDDLRQLGYVPLEQPYNVILGPRFAHTEGGGNEQTTSEVLQANAGTGDAIVDWVFVEIRDAADNRTIIRTFSALVQRDGDVVAADGTSLRISDLPASFYVAIKHRNHLGVMTASAVSPQSKQLVLDFTQMLPEDLWNQIGYNGLEMCALPDGRKALWGGNAHPDNKVKYDGGTNDRVQVAADIITYEGPDGGGNVDNSLNYDFTFGYFQGDINMNGKVKYDGSNNDRVIIQAIVIALYPFNVGNLNNFNNMLEQIPLP